MRNILTLIAFSFLITISAQTKPKHNGFRIVPQASPPSNPVAGEFYVDSDDNGLYKYNGATWDLIGSGGTDDQTAAEVPFTATGGIISTDTQAAVAEVDAEKAALAGATFTGNVLRDADGSTSIVTNMANMGFTNFTAGEGIKFTLGDDFNGFFNSFGNGLLLNSFNTQYFRQASTAPVDGDNFPDIANVSFNFLNQQNHSFRITEQSATSTADFLQFYNQEGSEVASFDVNGIYNGDIALDVTNFDNNLSGSDNTLQTAMETLDEISGSGIQSNTAGLTGASTVTNVVRANQSDIEGWASDPGRVAICEDCVDYDYIQIAASDLTTNITTGTSKAYFRMPYAATLSEVRVSLLAAGTGTGITVDINEDGTTVLSTKLTTDATEKTSTTATTAAVISDSALADDAEITIDFDAVPTNGQGVIVTLKLIKQ